MVGFVYTVTADEKFIAEPLSKGRQSSWVVSACSGHGFKFAPLLGDRLVEVITSGRIQGGLCVGGGR